MAVEKTRNLILNHHIILKQRDKAGIVPIKGDFEMEHTISRNNAQGIICFNCTLLRNVWGWRQNKMTFEIMLALESGAYFLIYHNSIAAHEVGMCRMAGENN